VEVPRVAGVNGARKAFAESKGGSKGKCPSLSAKAFLAPLRGIPFWFVLSLQRLSLLALMRQSTCAAGSQSGCLFCAATQVLPHFDIHPLLTMHAHTQAGAWTCACSLCCLPLLPCAMRCPWCAWRLWLRAPWLHTHAQGRGLC